MKERILHILSKERIMDTKLKNSTTLLIGLIAIILTGFIIGHSWTFALGKKPGKEQSQADPVEQRAAFLNNLAKAQHYPAKIMKTLENSIPADTTLTKITFSKKKLTIIGETPENDNIKKFLQSLKDRDMFENLEFKELGKPDREKPGVKFQVTALYKEESEDSDKKIKNQVLEQDSKTGVMSKEPLLNRLENRLAAEKEIAPTLRKLPGMITASKLKILRWTTMKDVNSYKESSPLSIYTEVPIMIELHGNLHHLALFFKNVSDLEKLAVVDELKIKPLSGKLKTGLFTREVMFKISFYIKSNSK
jgi:hypothetical protein